MSATSTSDFLPAAAAAVTIVTYPAGSLRESATVVHSLPDPRPGDHAHQLVVTDITPFHPLDPLWPDQPADHGMMHTAAGSFVVGDTVTIAARGSGPLMVGSAVDARRDEPGVAFYVAHVVDTEVAIAAGVPVVLEVDAHRRRRLSAAHTACHLLAYALNEVVRDLWRKPAPCDSRGHPDFDAATCVSTRHDEEGSYDSYRLGRSLRKRGFDTTAFLEDLPGVMHRVNEKLAGWIADDAPVRIDVQGPALSDRREWVCEVPGGTAHMPCGGTHVRHLGEIATMVATASFDAEAGMLHITNRVRPARDTSGRDPVRLR